jgi:hypothetical protein
MLELPLVSPIPRARVVRCPLTGSETLRVRCGAREIEVKGAANPHELATAINQQLARIRRSEHPGRFS